MSLRKFLVATLACFLSFYGNGQVMNPADPVIEYVNGFVAQPAYGQVGDWVKTTRLNWNTDDYKCYIYKGNIFRLKFPVVISTMWLMAKSIPYLSSSTDLEKVETKISMITSISCSMAASVTRIP